MTSTLKTDKIEGVTTAENVKLPSGSVLQTKQTILTTAESISGTSYADTGVTVSITPKYSSSKVRVTLNGLFGQNFWNATPFWRLRRDTTTISANDSTFWPRVQYDSTRDSESGLSLVMDVLDSPATTSSVAYTLQGKSSNGSYPLYLNRTVATSGPMAQTTITVMEIAQ